MSPVDATMMVTSERPQSGLDFPKEAVKVARRQGHVVLVHVPGRGGGRVAPLPDLPKFPHLAEVLGDDSVHDEPFFHDALDEPLELLSVVLVVGPVRLHKDAVVRGREGLLDDHGERHRMALRRLDQLQDGRVHEFEGGQDLAQVRRLGQVEDRQDVPEGRARQPYGADGGRQRRAKDCHLGDDAKGALPADEEVLQVVPRVVLQVRDGVAAQVEDPPPGRQDDLDAHHVGMQTPVPVVVDPTGIGGDVSADLARPLGPQVDGDEGYGVCGKVLQGVQDAPRVGPQNAAPRPAAAAATAAAALKAVDPVHLLQRQDHLVADGDAPPHQPRVSALRDDPYPPLVAVRQHPGHLVGRLGSDHHRGTAPVVFRPVDVVSVH